MELIVTLIIIEMATVSAMLIILKMAHLTALHPTKISAKVEHNFPKQLDSSSVQS